MFTFISNVADFLGICAKKSEDTEFKSVTMDAIHTAAEKGGMSAEEYLKQPGVKVSLMKNLSKDAEEVSRITGDIFKEWEATLEQRRLNEQARAEAAALILAKTGNEVEEGTEEATPEVESKFEAIAAKAARWFGVIASIVSSAITIYASIKRMSTPVANVAPLTA